MTASAVRGRKIAGRGRKANLEILRISRFAGVVGGPVALQRGEHTTVSWVNAQGVGFNPHRPHYCAPVTCTYSKRLYA